MVFYLMCRKCAKRTERERGLDVLVLDDMLRWYERPKRCARCKSLAWRLREVHEWRHMLADELASEVVS